MAPGGDRCRLGDGAVEMVPARWEALPTDISALLFACTIAGGCCIPGWEGSAASG